MRNRNGNRNSELKCRKLHRSHGHCGRRFPLRLSKRRPLWLRRALRRDLRRRDGHRRLARVRPRDVCARARRMAQGQGRALRRGHGARAWSRRRRVSHAQRAQARDAQLVLERERRNTCRVTVSDRDFGVVHVLARLRRGRHRRALVGAGSLLRAVGKLRRGRGSFRKPAPSCAPSSIGIGRAISSSRARAPDLMRQ